MFSCNKTVRRAALAALAMTFAQGAWAQESKMKLFKVITVKDDIVIGLSDAELKALGGADAGAVAHAIAQKGDLAAWQYNVRRGANGDLVQAPSARVGILASASLRVEPLATTYAIVPHE
jgi:fatty acid/phospholipid biosynthesis enzyme